MTFSQDNRLLLMYFEPVEEAINRQIASKSDGTYLLWDLSSKTSVNVKLWGSDNHIFDRLPFPYHVYGMYSNVSDEPETGLAEAGPEFPEEEQGSLSVSQAKVQIRCMLEDDDLFFLGDSQGFIHVIKNSTLSYPPNEIPGTLLA